MNPLTALLVKEVIVELARRRAVEAEDIETAKTIVRIAKEPEVALVELLGNPDQKAKATNFIADILEGFISGIFG